MAEQDIENLKESGNDAFHRRKFGPAIRLYTKAINSASGNTTPVETQRTLLANRAQAYISFGLIYDGLQDLDQALSPHYTTQVSPKRLTAKCHFRRAKVLSVMARYDRASEDYNAFMRIMDGLAALISSDERRVGADIEEGKKADKGSERGKKDALRRAVDARGFIVHGDDHQTFPSAPPHAMEDLEPDASIQFATEDGLPDPRPSSDPNSTPLLIPIRIGAPYYFSTPPFNRPFSTHTNPESEFQTVRAIIEGLFFSVSGSGGPIRVDTEEGQENFRSTMEHERKSVVVVITFRGRLLVIPRETKLKDIVAGARWPRDHQQDVPTFQDLRKAPREKHRVDGIQLQDGWLMSFLVVPKSKLDEMTDKLETGLAQTDAFNYARD